MDISICLHFKNKLKKLQLKKTKQYLAQCKLRKKKKKIGGVHDNQKEHSLHYNKIFKHSRSRFNKKKLLRKSNLLCYVIVNSRPPPTMTFFFKKKCKWILQVRKKKKKKIQNTI